MTSTGLQLYTTAQERDRTPVSEQSANDALMYCRRRCRGENSPVAMALNRPSRTPNAPPPPKHYFIRISKKYDSTPFYFTSMVENGK